MATSIGDRFKAAWADYRRRKKEPKVSAHELTVFTRQFLTMLDAGIPILRSLDFYGDTDQSPMGRIIRDLAHHVRGGNSLSSALAKFPGVFSRLYIGLVATGEKSGSLSEMLKKVVEVLERLDALQNRVKAAITYPLCMLFVATCVFLGFVYFILPQMQPILASMKVEPPLPTLMLMWMGNLLRNPVFIVSFIALALGGIFLGPLAWLTIRQDKDLCVKIDQLPLLVPGLGPLVKQVLLSRVLYAMAVTIEMGMTLTTSLDLTRQISSNEYVANEIRQLRTKIEDGHSLATSMASSSLFGSGVVQMVSVGEETSSLSTSLQFVCKLYDDIAEDSIRSLTALLEPILMLGMGFVAGFLVIASILPVVKMLNSL